MDLFLVKKVLTVLVLPPTGPLILSFLGLILLKAKPTLGRGLAWTGILMLLAFSLPFVSHALQSSLDDSPPLDLTKAGNAQVIVILGGGVRPNALEYGGDTLGRLTLERVRYGALVARKTRLPILVTGGAVFGTVPEASLMRQSLEEEFNVKVRWAEGRSRNTHENAIRSAEILLASGTRSVILVTHGFDMRRAKAEFTAAGLEVTPAPTHVPNGTFDGPLSLLPNMSSLQGSYYALYELLANAVRKLGI
jgi:uncharacterized SAM-binding protein YcdF (DUF218 family)